MRTLGRRRKMMLEKMLEMTMEEELLGMLGRRKLIVKMMKMSMERTAAAFKYSSRLSQTEL